MSIDNIFAFFLGPSTLRLSPVSEPTAAWRQLGTIAEALGTKIVETLSPSIVTRDDSKMSGITLNPASSGSTWDVLWETYVSNMKLFVEFAEEYNLLLAVEPRPRDLLSNTDSVLRLFDRIDSNNLGAVIDFGNLHVLRESPALSVRKLAHKTFSVHLSDNDGITEGHWPPGQGKVDWLTAIKSLAITGYDGLLSLDVSGIDTAQEVLDGKEYVEGLLGQISLVH